MTTIKTAVIAGVAIGVLALSTTSAVLAWHPHGVIVKNVQDQTKGTSLVDANDANSAVTVAHGDAVNYAITISNTAPAAADGDNDMAKTTLTDTLPDGVELVADPSQRVITENLGVIKPGQSVTKQYAVKVTSNKDGQVITNKACFTGNSLANDNPQNGCDNAVITVSVPKPAPTPAPTPTPPQVLSAKAPAVLPATGPADLFGSAVGLSAISYSAVAYLRSRRNK